jgi:nucleoside-diphosphate kinase
MNGYRIKEPIFKKILSKNENILRWALFIERKGEKMKTYAFIIMKPDALEQELVETITQRFSNEGFSIEKIGYRNVNEQLILKHYHEVIERFGEGFKEAVISSYAGKGMIPILLSQESTNAIANSRALTGETDPSKAEKGTIRGDYGDDTMEAANLENRSCNNLIHCSDSEASLLEEAKLWFGEGLDFGIK